MEPVKRGKKRARGGENKRLRAWCFTVFDFTPNVVLGLRSLGRSDKTTYLVFGRERCPSTGRRHLQGYVRFHDAKTFSAVQKLLGSQGARPHIEPSGGTDIQNREYCSKEGDFEQYGEPAIQGKRSDLARIQAEIEEGKTQLDIARDHFTQWVVYRRSFEAYRELLYRPELRTQLRVYVIVGAPGVGKTRYVFDYCQRTEQGLYFVDDVTLGWFDGYNSQPVACIDDYRGGGRYEFLLRLLDIYPLQVPRKGGFVHWEPLKIFITSNTEPSDWHPDHEYAPLKRRISRIARIADSSYAGWESVKEFLTKQFE